MKWLKPLDFKKTEKKLLTLMKQARTLKQLVAIYILYIQLKNGTRLSESIQAYSQFVENGRREQYVRVRKAKTPKQRLVIIPGAVKRIDAEVTDRYVRYVCNKLLNCNTHSLRYAYITYLTQLNIPSHLIQKITKHSQTEMIEHYTNELLAIQLQRKIAK